jgi:hypothetical protein
VTGEHPGWCDRDRCTVAESGTGAHLSARAAVAGSVVAAWIHAPASQPNEVSVQVSCPERLLSPHEAYNLGRVLTFLGKAARKTSASAVGTPS